MIYDPAPTEYELIEWLQAQNRRTSLCLGSALCSNPRNECSYCFVLRGDDDRLPHEILEDLAGQEKVAVMGKLIIGIRGGFMRLSIWRKS